MRYRITETTVYEIEAANAGDAGRADVAPYLAISRKIEPLPPTVEERYIAAVPTILELLAGIREGFEGQGQKAGS